MKINILGIDPALRQTGWGILAYCPETKQIEYVASGLIKTQAKQLMSQRLKYLAQQVQKICQEYPLNAGVIEEVFVNKNAATSLLLGQARGAIITQLALAELKLFAYAANLIKKTVTGRGHADKMQVQAMLKLILKCDLEFATHDISDALAVALCHIQQFQSTEGHLL